MRRHSDGLGYGVIILGLVILGTMLFIVNIILGVLVGGFTGWVVQSIRVLRVPVTKGFAVMGIDVNGKLIHVGSMLGFVGGFFGKIVRYSRRED